MKIKQLQSGGFLTYAQVNPIPLQVQDPNISTKSKSSSSSKGEEEGLLSKETIKHLLENGLANDVESYFSSLLNLQRQVLINPRLAGQLMLSLYSQVNKIIQNKAILEDAVKRADKNNGLNEYAITTTGLVIVLNMENGKIEQMSAAELKDNRDLYRPLTNSELVLKRLNDPTMAFNTNISSIVGNGIGGDKISDYILGIASKIGSSKFTQEGYVNKRAQNIDEGIQAMLAGGEDGIYKIKKSSSEQSKLMLEALTYLYTTLPLNMKNYLRVAAAANGWDPEKGSLELIQKMLISTAKTTDETSIDFDNQQTTIANKGKKSSSEDDEKGLVSNSQAITMMAGQGTQYVAYRLNPGTPFEGFTPNAQWFNTLLKNDLKPFGESVSLKRVMKEGDVSIALDWGSVYFGDQKVNEGQFDKIVYENGSGFVRAVLPFKYDNEGHKVPDFAVLDKINEADKEISDKKFATDLEKRQVFERRGLSDKWFDVYVASLNGDGSVAYQQGLVAPFFIATAITSNDRDTGMSGDNKLVNRIKGSNKDPYLKQYLTAVNEKENLDGSKPGNWTSENGFFNWFGGEDILRGNIYIPINDDKASALVANNSFYTLKARLKSETILENSNPYGHTNANYNFNFSQ